MEAGLEPQSKLDELTNEFYEHKEEVSTLDSDVRILDGKVEHLGQIDGREL